jgi:hypothetical protein
MQSKKESYYLSNASSKERCLWVTHMYRIGRAVLYTHRKANQKNQGIIVGLPYLYQDEQITKMSDSINLSCIFTTSCSWVVHM